MLPKSSPGERPSGARLRGGPAIEGVNDALRRLFRSPIRGVSIAPRDDVFYKLPVDQFKTRRADPSLDGRPMRKELLGRAIGSNPPKRKLDAGPLNEVLFPSLTASFPGFSFHQMR